MGKEEGSSLAQRNFEAGEDGRLIKAKRKIRGRRHLCHIQLAQHHLTGSHTVFKCMIPALIALLQVEYQSKTQSPFDTHPVNIWVFFAAFCSFGLGWSIQHHFRNRFINGVITSSGALSSVSLASIFLPRLLGWFCLGLWILLPIALGRHFIKRIYNWLKHNIQEKSLLAYAKIKRFCGYVTGNNQKLPLTAK